MSIASAARMTVISEHVDATVDRFIGVVSLSAACGRLFHFGQSSASQLGHSVLYASSMSARKLVIVSALTPQPVVAKSTNLSVMVLPEYALRAVTIAA